MLTKVIPIAFLFPMFKLSPKLHEIHLGCFWLIFLTERQTTMIRLVHFGFASVQNKNAQLLMLRSR